LDFFNKELKKC
jgi:hypothetical protein